MFSRAQEGSEAETAAAAGAIGAMGAAGGTGCPGPADARSPSEDSGVGLPPGTDHTGR